MEYGQYEGSAESKLGYSKIAVVLCPVSISCTRILIYIGYMKKLECLSVTMSSSAKTEELNYAFELGKSQSFII